MKDCAVVYKPKWDPEFTPNPNCGLFDGDFYKADTSCCGCGGGQINFNGSEYTENDFETLWKGWWSPAKNVSYRVIMYAFIFTSVGFTSIPLTILVVYLVIAIKKKEKLIFTCAQITTYLLISISFVVLIGYFKIQLVRFILAPKYKSQ